MKLGEIKLEALKIMFANYNHDITIEGLVECYADENYGSYLINMPGSINRCLSVIENKGVLPSKRVVLEATRGVASGQFIRFDLFSMVPDLYIIERVIKEDTYGFYNGDYQYQLEGEVLVLDRPCENETYTLIYKPSLPRITQDSSDINELQGVPNNIACHIPYFIKGDLFREDEPNEASEARNWFEQAMDEIQHSQINRVNQVQSIYTQTEY